MAKPLIVDMELITAIASATSRFNTAMVECSKEFEKCMKELQDPQLLNGADGGMARGIIDNLDAIVDMNKDYTVKIAEVQALIFKKIGDANQYLSTKNTSTSAHVTDEVKAQKGKFKGVQKN